jgi:hypothetical protein
LGGGHLNHYVGVLITSDMSFNTMVGLIIINGLQILELFLSIKPKVENSSNLELTRVLSYNQRTSKLSHAVGPCKTISDAMNQTSVQEMVYMEPWVDMVITPYCYDEVEPSDQKDNFHVNDIVEDDEQGEPINQTIRPLFPKFKYVSGSAHMSHMNSCLNTKLRVRQIF